MSPNITRSLFVSSCVVLVAACQAEPEQHTAGTPAVDAAPSLETVVELGVRNAREPLPGVVSGGQPTQEQLEALASAGYTNFVSLRPVAEEGAGWEEADAVEHGHGFARLPISGAASLTRENVEAFAAIMSAVDDEPTVVYCGSGNRVGAMLALKAHWVDGLPADDALALGLEGGMTRLEPAVRELLGLGPGG